MTAADPAQHRYSQTSRVQLECWPAWHALVVVTCLLMQCVPSYGQDQASAGSGVSAAKPNLLSNVRVSVVNGLVQKVNNTLKLRFRPEWAFLPESNRLSALNLSEKSVRGVDPKYLKPIVHVITDEQMSQGPSGWSQVLAHDQAPAGLDAMVLRGQGALLGPITGDPQTWIDAWHAGYLKYWGGADAVAPSMQNEPPTGVSPQDLENNAILPSDLLAQRRDHALLNMLLRANGADATITPKKVAPGLINIKRVPGSHGEWEVRQYPFRYKLQQNGEPDRYFFRTVVIGRLPEYEVTVFNAGLKSVTLDIQLEWIPRTGQSPLLFRLGVSDPVIRFGEVTVEPEPVVKDKLKELETEGGPSKFETYLGLFGGVNAATAVSNSLIGGTRDTSFVSGGMYAGRRVSSMVGFTHEVGDPTSPVRPGLVFGLDPADSNRLFLGAGLRTGMVQAAVGVASVQEDRTKRNPPGTGTVQKGELAGVLNFDLSRAFGGKTTVKNLTVDNSIAGGTIGLASDTLVSGTGGYVLFLDNRTEANDPGRPYAQIWLESESTPPAIVRLNSSLKYQTLFLPAGRYLVKLGPGLKLKDESGNELLAPKIPVSSGIWTVNGSASARFTLYR